MPSHSPEARSVIVPTSIIEMFVPRLERIHQGRRIGVFAGPPGIGKSTAIEAFRAEYECNVAVVPVPPGPKGGVRATTALQLLLQGFYELSPRTWRDTIPTKYVELRNRLYNVVCELVGFDSMHTRRGGQDVEEAPPLTIVFDEAQNLARDAIEVLRFANDRNGGYSPFPLGLAFIGNNEFALKSDGRGESVLSAAVADRAIYNETFSYSDVTDRDLMLFLKSRGIADAEAQQLVVRYFASGRVNRSFRRIRDLLSEVTEHAHGEPITAAAVRHCLGLS